MYKLFRFNPKLKARVSASLDSPHQVACDGWKNLAASDLSRRDFSRVDTHKFELI